MTRRTERTARVLESIWYGADPRRWLLYPFALAYGFATRLRRVLYRRGVLKSERVAVPVVVVGNVTVGGTGKTPITIWLALKLRECGYRVGIVCRGYRGRADSWPQEVFAESDAGQVGDESVLLAIRTRCPVVAGPDRVAAAKRLLERHGVDVILSDDGMQHYRLDRSLELAVVDGQRGLGNGWCLPAGPLREPAERLAEVDAVIVTEGEWGHAGVIRCRIGPRCVYELASRAEKPLDHFRGQRVHAVAGIGHPGRFFGLLECNGLVAVPHPLADHADIEPGDLEFDDGLAVIVTEKDAVKCRSFAPAGVWCLVVDVEFAARDGERLMRLVTRHLEGGSH